MTRSVSDGVGAIALTKAFEAEEFERYDYGGEVGHVTLTVRSGTFG